MDLFPTGKCNWQKTNSALPYYTYLAQKCPRYIDPLHGPPAESLKMGPFSFCFYLIFKTSYKADFSNSHCALSLSTVIF